MARVLVVDDEPRYRGYVARLLEAEGHEVGGAASAREAIERGVREPPDLVVVDWLLGGAHHGLHALDALRAVRAELPCVLVTGFPSAELASSARRAGVARLVEKPFEAAELRRAVEAALAERPEARAPELAVLELGAEGSLVSRSPAAKALLAAWGAGGPEALAALFGTDDPGLLGRAAERWVEGAPRGATGERAWIRVQPVPREGGPEATRLAVLHRGASPDEDTCARAELLLGLAFEADPMATPPLEGRVLLVDPDLFLRRVEGALLEKAGVQVAAAESHEQALALLEHGPGYACAVVDESTPALASLVSTLRTRFPEVALVGQTEAAASSGFRALGVEIVLRKPWSLRQFRRALQAGRESAAS